MLTTEQLDWKDYTASVTDTLVSVGSPKTGVSFSIPLNLFNVYGARQRDIVVQAIRMAERRREVDALAKDNA